MTTPIPVAEVIAQRTYGGRRTVRILCPYCGRTHLHPQPADPAAPQTARCDRGIYTIGGRA
ncbi:hypothetical protein [Mycobacterium sp. E2238]|uniref:hypothetical protein n=1 Tax=Mycobacterium sp. E2238 TaxID=1834131 RepID=UPI000A8F9294|nr:hypothetical protein [Mycobacterium sp. E2238]